MLYICNDGRGVTTVRVAEGLLEAGVIETEVDSAEGEGTARGVVKTLSLLWTAPFLM